MKSYGVGRPSKLYIAECIYNHPSYVGKKSPFELTLTYSWQDLYDIYARFLEE